MKQRERRHEVYFVGNQGKKTSPIRKNNFIGYISLILAAVFFIGITIGELPVRSSSYRSILTTARASPNVPKNFYYFSGKVADFFSEGYKLGNVFSMVEEGKKVETNLNFSQYVAVNLGANHFSTSALDILYLSSELIAGKTPAMIKHLSQSKNNHARSFTPIPYREFFEKSKWERSSNWMFRDHSPVPQLIVNKGLPTMDNQPFHFKRKFADGKTRKFQPKEPFLALLPNIRNGVSEAQPSLEPAEALPFALMYYSKFYDKKNNKWIHLEELKEQIAIQYAPYAGIEIDPSQIEISRTGKRSRFLYHGEVGKNITYVFRQNKENDEIESVPVAVVNSKKELLMFASTDYSQAIFIPISRLLEIDDDEILLATSGSPFSYNDILEELAIAKDNQQAQVFPLYGIKAASQRKIPTSALVVKTKRLEILANALIGDAQTSDEALRRIKSFIDQTLPYGSDAKREGWGVDIQMTPLNTMVNGLDDCEGHATLYASLVYSASHPTLASVNKYIGLMESSYTNLNDEVVGHISPMVIIPGKQTKTNPFPNHVLANLDGQKMPLFYVEATGLVPDPQGVVSLQRRAMEPIMINVFTGEGAERILYTAGLNEFKHFPDNYPTKN